MRAALALLLLSAAIASATDSATDCGTERWELFITEAAARFEIPAHWLRAIIRSESAGCERLNRQPTTSDAGAMGLMQLMPATWREYRQRLKLGDNAYDPRKNILAGAAYLRDLFDRYGWPGAAAAYHAGPQRYEEARNHGKPLPAATLDYLARVERAMIKKPSTSADKVVREPAKPNALFVELRHRNGRAQNDREEAPDVQTR